MKWATSITAVAVATLSMGASGQLIDDFSGGVTAVNHPNPADGGTEAFATYYDITNDAFGSASDGGGFLRIDDGGFTNGVYAIYEAVIPADGTYQLEAVFNLEQTNDGVIDQYEIGAVVNGVHRGANPSDLAVLNPADPGTGIAVIDTDPGVSLGPITTLTSAFTASAGDNLLVAFSTNLTGPDFDANTTFWNGSFVTIDDLKLVVPEPTSLVLLGLGGLAMLKRRRA
ncbi:MAG: PEP-CTERM sorting domain-containing protein [Planctomycetota bacterium]